MALTRACDYCVMHIAALTTAGLQDVRWLSGPPSPSMGMRRREQAP